MPVVTAGVHHAADTGLIRHIIFFGDGQGIHVGPHRNGATGLTATQPRHDAGNGRARKLEPRHRREGLENKLRGAVFVEGELGVLMQMPANRNNFIKMFFGLLLNMLHLVFHFFYASQLPLF